MKICRTIGTAVMGATLLAIVPMLAHHAPQGEFDLLKEDTIAGTVKRMEWISPHPSLVLDVTDPQTGDVVTWQFEADGIQTMRRGGVGRRTLTFGTEVAVTYWPAFDDAERGFIRALETADGKSYTVYFGDSEPIAEDLRGRR